MYFILAIIPIVLILVLMVGLRWGAARAGGAGYLSALFLSVIFFGAGPNLLAFAHIRSLFLSADVLLIIWGAFLLYRVADEAGAIRTIGLALPHLTADKGMQAIIIGWVFASFLQGVGGFGVPVAVIAPLMIGLGFNPMSAVVIPSLGHGWAVTFGSLGSSFQALIAATDLPGELLAPDSALFLGISAVFVGMVVVHCSGGWKDIYRLILPILVIGVVMGVFQYIFAVTGLWNLAAFGGSVAGLLVGFPLSRKFHGDQQGNRALIYKDVIIALSGYAILIITALAVQLNPDIRAALSQFVIQADLPEVRTELGYVTPAGTSRAIPLFAHPGAILAYSSITAFLIYWGAKLYQPGSVRRILSGTVRKVMSSSVSIASMVAMAVIMENAGMIEVLANGLAGVMGAAYPAVAPWIGALGSFMTGSNTNSNVVFGMLQLRTAELLGYAVPVILAGQTAGAGLASVMAPTKVVVGASTAGMAGREGEVMQKMIGYTFVLVVLISILTLARVLLAD
jgi:lactate permease